MKKYCVIILTAAFVLMSGCGHAKLYHDMPTLEFDQIEYGFKVEKKVINGTEVAYYDGTPQSLRLKKTPLVLIHGLASNMGFWRGVIPELEKRGFRVIAIDLPGYGKSAKAFGAPYTLSFYAKTVHDLLSSLGVPKATWVGHSMGGQISMVASLSLPDRIENLVLVSPAGLESFKQGEGEWLRNATNPDFIIKTPPDRIRANYANNFYSWSENYEWMIEERVRLIKAKEFERFAYAVWKSVGAMLDEPVWDKLDRINFPTLIIAGENDNLIPNPFLHGGKTIDVMKIGEEKIKGSKLIMLPETGHMLVIERAKELASEIESFLK
ncbi:MAG: alpha/beta hydrolase [Chloroherpetonaceae bacterium]|nr:alpha/beta hydrolase [Chloroherpetonaceae bacterium]